MYKIKSVGNQTLDLIGLDMTDGQIIDLKDYVKQKDIDNSFEIYSKLKEESIIRIPNSNELRILRYIKDAANVKRVDFSLLGFTASPWEFHRGARTSRDYFDDQGNLIVRDKYNYDFFDDGRGVSNMSRHIEWYSEDDTVGLTKDITGNLNKKKMKQLNRDLRQGRIDYLEASAEGLREMAANVPSPYYEQYMAIADSIDVLFSHYSVQVDKYISRGTMDFESAVLGETIPGIVQILEIPSDVPSEKFPSGLTVKYSILYQLRGYLLTPGDVIEPS